MQRRRKCVVIEFAEPFERAERDGSHRRIRRPPPHSSRGHVARVSGNGHGTSTGRNHCFNKSVSVITRNALPNAMTTASTAPITIAMLELATAAHSRRNGPGRLYSDVVVSAIGTGSH